MAEHDNSMSLDEGISRLHTAHACSLSTCLFTQYTLVRTNDRPALAGWTANPMQSAPVSAIVAFPSRLKLLAHRSRKWRLLIAAAAVQLPAAL